MDQPANTSAIYVLVTIVVMIVAGILGSYCRKIFGDEYGNAEVDVRNGIAGTFRVVVPGIVASFVIPLFLSIGKSQVFSDAVKGQYFAENIFIVFGFCLLAAVSARSFVNAIAQQALQKAGAAKRRADEAVDLLSEEQRPSTPPPKGDSESTNRALDNFQGSGAEKAVMKSLVDTDYVRRSLTGIAKATNLEKSEVRNVLAALAERDLVVSSLSKRTGNLLYQAKMDGSLKLKAPAEKS